MERRRLGTAVPTSWHGDSALGQADVQPVGFPADASAGRGPGHPLALAWSWIVTGQLTLVAVLIAYLTMVAANTWGFSYSFWSEPPPSDGARTFATASLVVMFIVVAGIGVIGYGWFCQLEATGQDRWPALRTTIGPALRASWYAIPLAAGCAVVLFVPVLGAQIIVGTALLAIERWVRPASARCPAGRSGARSVRSPASPWSRGRSTSAR